MSDQNVQQLLEKLLKGEITAAEQESLAAWINAPENAERTEPLLEAAWQQFKPSEYAREANGSDQKIFLPPLLVGCGRRSSDGRKHLVPAAAQNNFN
jgi:hypothetical protein